MAASFNLSTDSITVTEPFASLPPFCRFLFNQKAANDFTFEQLGKAMQRDEIYIASIFYGQARPDEDTLRSLSKVLKLSEDDTAALQSLAKSWWPHRGLGQSPPTDPVIYRLHEGMLVYGYPIKSTCTDNFPAYVKFGDGIMSMIDCKVHVAKKEDPAGARVVLTFDGKFLPYATW